MELVKGSVNSAHIADLVRQRGIDFDPTEEYFQSLRNAGAEQVLIDAFASARTIKPPAPAPSPAEQAKQHLRGANYLMGMGDTDGAITLYRESIQENPNSSEAHRLLGIAYGKKKDWPRDAAEQRAAMQLDPGDAAAKTELDFSLRSGEQGQVRIAPLPAPAVSRPRRRIQLRKPIRSLPPASRNWRSASLKLPPSVFPKPRN